MRIKQLIILVTLYSLLHSFSVQSDAVVFASSPRSLDTIVSDATKTNNGSNATRTVYVPTSVNFSTQHKSYSHHTAIPPHNLSTMNTQQLLFHFARHGYTEEQILSRADLYASAAYLAIAKQLPKYPEYVKKYHNEYRKFNWYTKCVGRLFSFYTPGYQNRFAELHQECEEQKHTHEARERKKHEEHAQKEKELVAYCDKIEALMHDDITIDAVPYQHQQARSKAHAQIKTTAIDRVTQKYTVAPDTIIFAQEYDIAEHDLNTMCGNTYEQQLHSEFLEQLGEAHAISNYYALQPKNILIDAVGHGVAIGMEANRLKQPDTATKWANFGWKALEIIQAAGEGLLLWVENTAWYDYRPC